MSDDLTNSLRRLVHGSFERVSRPLRSVRRPALFAIAVTLFAAGAIGASMTALSWNNAGGGTASTAANWSPVQVPTSADDLTFNLNNTYTVTYNASAAASRTQTYRQGDVMLSVSSPHTTSNGITVGDLAGDIASATLTTGTLTSNALVVVGDAAGSTGTLNVTDGAIIPPAKFLLATSTGDLVVGNNGAGTLAVTGGGLVQVADRFTAGSNSSSTAALTVTGSRLVPLTRSMLEVDGTGLTSAIGAGGDVTMDVSFGGVADFAGNVNIAQGAFSTTTVTVEEAGLSGVFDPRLDIGGNLTIAGNQAAGTAGGVGTVNVNADGHLNVVGSLAVAGDPDGGIGTLNVTAGGAATANSADVGAGGTLDLDGGTFDVGGNVKVLPSGTLLVTNGILTVADSITIDGLASLTSGTMSAEVFTLSTDLTASGTIDADVRIVNSLATVTAGAGDLTLGRYTGINGFLNLGVLDCANRTVTIEDGNSAAINTVLLGGGTLIVPNGASVSGADSIFGRGVVDADIQNSGKIKGAATGLTFKGIVTGVGQGFTGPATSFIASGGFVGAGTIGSPIFGDATSSFTATGALTMGNSPSATGINIDGALSAGANTVTLLDLDAAELAGATTLSGGTVTAANGLLLQNGGSITGSGTVDAEFDGDAGSSIVATGALAIGKSTESDGFDTDGALAVGASSVTLRSLDNARLGRSTTISGGTLTHTGFGQFKLDAGDSLTGSGTVSGQVLMTNTCVITATGPLTMGSSGSVTGFDGLGGTLHVGASAVTLLDQDLAKLPDLTTIDGGSLSSAVPLLIGAGETLRGTGQVTTQLLVQGRIEPGDPIGTLTLTDGLLVTNGTIAVQIGGAGSQANDADPAHGGESAAKSGTVVWDQIDVTGTATLAGILRIGQLPGLVVAAGDSFPILTCASRSGTFASIVFDDPYLENVFDVVYTPTAVVLVARATTGVDLPPVGDPSDGSPDDGVGVGSLLAEFGLRVSGRNPFSAADGAAFEYDIPRGGAPVSISVFDASGRRVADLVSGAQFAGTHAARWNGAELSALPSGVYFLRMDAEAFGETRRLVLIR